jgi:hypothetical protein
LEESLNLLSNGLREERPMTEKIKITIRQIINRAFDMLTDIEKQKAHFCKNQAIDRNKLRHISNGINSCLEYSPAEQHLKSFLMSLEEEQLRKILTLYFAGRDDEKDIYGQYHDSKRHFSSKEDIIYRLLDTQILKDSLLSALTVIDEQDIDLEDSFDKNHQH